MATLTQDGRAGLAASVKARNIYLGIGSGQTAWDTTTPAESTASSALTTAVGYRVATQKDFVVTAPGTGAISLPSGRYDVSATQTNQLYLRFTLDFADASSATIRETGIFLDTTPNGGLPAGQQFFTTSEVSSAGTLYLVEHIAAIIRTAATRETFEFVLQF